MQSAKDTFYTMLQGRLTALNPARTIVLRGLVRPGVLVEENELTAAAVIVDAFRLRWTAATIESAGPLPLVGMVCEIHYATDGTAGNGAMDRGRLLAAMDIELASALTAVPTSVPKMNYAAAGVGVAAVAMHTNVFWGDPVFAAAVALGERMERTATVQVFSYQEAGER
jgi:hypothetical protein